MTNSEKKEMKKELTGALIGLARASQGNGLAQEAQIAVYRGLKACAEDADERELCALTERIRIEKGKLAPNCADCAEPCGRNDDYDMERLYSASDEIRSAKLKFLNTLLLFAPPVLKKAENGGVNEKICLFFCRSLYAMGTEWSREELEGYFQSILKEAAEELIKLNA